MNDSKSEQVYHCKVFDVWEDEVELPNGKTVKQSRIDHKPTVAIVAINEKNELLLIKQYRNAVKQDLLEIPAGTFDDPEESAVACAQRELAEETGFKARSLVKLFEGYLLPGYCNEYMYFFLALDLFSEPLTPDMDEFIETIPVSLPEASKLVEKGEIIDAKTVLGIFLANNLMQQNPA